MVNKICKFNLRYDTNCKEVHQLSALCGPRNMYHRLITALIALIIQSNESFVNADKDQFISTTGKNDYFLNGFDVYLKQSFFERYPTTKTINFVNCKIVFEEENEENDDFWAEEIDQFPLERLSFKNCTISKSKGTGNSEPGGNSIQDRMGNFKEIVFESCYFPDGMVGTTFFLNTATLTHLKIIDCDVTFFKYDSFYPLQNLQYVEVKNTNILLYPVMFSHNTKLQHLDMPWNPYEALLNHDFPTTLEYLDISGYNSLIVCVTLQGLNQLEYLNMSHTRNLITPTGDCFPKTLPNLEVLDFSWNHLKSLTHTFLAGMQKLKELYLNDNEMEFIHQNAFKYLYDVEVLDLNNNRLVTIKEGAFGFLLSLKYLHIKNNVIATRTMECYKNRATLDVDYKNDSCLDRFSTLKRVHVVL